MFFWKLFIICLLFCKFSIFMAFKAWLGDCKIISNQKITQDHKTSHWISTSCIGCQNYRTGILDIIKKSSKPWFPLETLFKLPKEEQNKFKTNQTSRFNCILTCWIQIFNQNHQVGSKLKYNPKTVFKTVISSLKIDSHWRKKTQTCIYPWAIWIDFQAQLTSRNHLYKPANPPYWEQWV